jgi:hypothetical protein
MLDTLTSLLQPWADLYADHTVLSTTIVALHLLAMFVGGGIAIAADRRLLQAAPGSSEAYRAAAADLQTQHSLVIATLAATILTGLALVTADIGTFAVSRVYWTKMAVFVLLLFNGARMRRTEGRVLRAVANTTEFAIAGPALALPWAALRRSAIVSATCWCALVVLGVVVSNG